MALKRTVDVVLVADIGGTNARFACFDAQRQQLLSCCSLPVIDYPDIYEALNAARQRLPEFDAADIACIAIAGPVTGDRVQATNSDWAFALSELQKRYGWSELIVINDFLAAAYGIQKLEPSHYHKVGTPEPVLPSPTSAVLIGPGTGLGVAALLPVSGSGQWQGMATEAGHARLAPGSDEDLALLAVLQEQLRVVQREDVLSGRGLCNLHRAWVTLHGQSSEIITDSSRITATALRDSGSAEAKVLDCFCAILGTVAADVALEFAAWEGVYLAGGILPRMKDFFTASRFRQHFDHHPQFSDRLRQIPTVVITEDSLGLLGAAQYLQQHYLHGFERRQSI